MNKVLLSGYLGHNPDIINGGVKFNLALKHKQTDEKTTWVRVVVFGLEADSCLKCLTKGSFVIVEGKIDNLLDEDGKVMKTSIIASHVEFVNIGREANNEETTIQDLHSSN